MTIFIIIAAYLTGSVNFAIILLLLLGKEDPRTTFSGNAGTTNVYRQAGMFWAAMVLILDVGRALAIGAAALYFLDTSLVPWVGLALITGNCYPCFHGFRGGKGVASYVGFGAALSPISSMLSCIVWIILFGIIRIPFVASFFMIVTIATGTVLTFSREPTAIAGILATVLLIFYNHKTNVQSLRKKATGN